MLVSWIARSVALMACVIADIVAPRMTVVIAIVTRSSTSVNPLWRPAGIVCAAVVAIGLLMKSTR